MLLAGTGVQVQGGGFAPQQLTSQQMQYLRQMQYMQYMQVSKLASTASGSPKEALGRNLTDSRKDSAS